MTREDRYANSSHGRPNLWACFALADNDQQRNEVQRNATKYCIDSGRQLSGEGRA
ncbi:MAG: hypothetical protein V3S67_06925 [Gammaproteobacteria bacterium]